MSDRQKEYITSEYEIQKGDRVVGKIKEQIYYSDIIDIIDGVIYVAPEILNSNSLTNIDGKWKLGNGRSVTCEFYPKTDFGWFELCQEIIDWYCSIDTDEQFEEYFITGSDIPRNKLISRHNLYPDIPYPELDGSNNVLTIRAKNKNGAIIAYMNWLEGIDIHLEYTKFKWDQLDPLEREKYNTIAEYFTSVVSPRLENHIVESKKSYTVQFPYNMIEATK